MTGHWSEIWFFTTGNPPSVPVQVSPVNGSLIRSYKPEFNWNDSTIPAMSSFKYYQIQIDDSKDFSTPLTDTFTTENNIMKSEFIPDVDLASNTRFYWRVRVINTIDTIEHFSGWSPVLSFRTILLPPQNLAVLENGQTPILEWDDATGTGTITGYTIQVSTSSNFSTFLVNTTTQPSASQYPMMSRLPISRTIYWRVRVNGLNGPSAWSKDQFTIPE